MVPLFCQSNFSFLTGASHPHELVEAAALLGYSAIAITDECSLAGIVKAHVAAKERGIDCLIGSYFQMSSGARIIAIAPSTEAYCELSGYISLARRRMPKGQYEAHFEDLRFRLQHCLIIWLISPNQLWRNSQANQFYKAFGTRLWFGYDHRLEGFKANCLAPWLDWAQNNNIPIAACPHILMHIKQRKPLLDTLWAIRHNSTLESMGSALASNAEAVLKKPEDWQTLYPEEFIEQTVNIASHCYFSLDSLRYQYPKEVVPKGIDPDSYLQQLVEQGFKKRWPDGAPKDVEQLVNKELTLIKELNYAYYFLTVYDIVRFAKERGILCQGRGSAANSVVCYCLFITEISPGQINVLFERFISKERDEPPDIDVDFEHQRREEVIQYIYQKYTRERAALAATVITYRARSAIRDVGKALGLDAPLIEHLAKSLAWWDRKADLEQRIRAAGFNEQSALMPLFYSLVQQILGFPRHLSQHVGGFVITNSKLADLVPIENASMPERTVIQWDKDDIEAMGLLKIDVLALGMLSALRLSLSYIDKLRLPINGIGPIAPAMQLHHIPKDDSHTYNMLSIGDSVGVFQVESRAQMAMLPRLKPKCFYDLVIQIAIVRPGPIQGDMVHPYIRRRNKLEPVVYENDAVAAVLKPTLGVPIFQEQAIRLAMVAAGFSGGQADQLRRAMASFGKNGRLLQFETRFIEGMLNNGYSRDYAERLFNQIKGFGGYGFPESHSASFALLCYASAWVKRHYPEAFYCALLNSQPMGFYSPSQLIQDGIRHRIRFLPVDANFSDWSHQVVPYQKGWAVRLGFLKIKGFSEVSAKKIIAARPEHLFNSLSAFKQLTGLTSADIERLAKADALASITGNRQKALWQSGALSQSADDLFYSHSNDADHILPTVAEAQHIQADYQMLGFSLRRHPMALLRNQPSIRRCKSFAELSSINHGGFVRVAGIVTGRQRPGTAKGTVFLTLEDETGNTNVVVWKNTQSVFRQALLGAKCLIITGRLERQGDVTHVIAGRLEDCTGLLENLAVRSRDFH
ncbi:error-prone DNA polymerase [Marinagarivorans cellulosilyticus]|uniref:Error-prone DNA polymerase n=1 Tax=Marinagarivorans cellulosilyticus TaxID=2721545 RepID=A0AAN2BIF2_9GAMM|nr:error-prone DNA polymerase [Marinagarivorans cellulosilyticus]BCD95806.1 error-prone DNA polymerase [Marinagarivorans cellulosilyticus]